MSNGKVEYKVYADFQAFGPDFVSVEETHYSRRVGWVSTKHGIVKATRLYFRDGGQFVESSRFLFVHGGRTYSRVVSGKAYTDQGLVRAARRFADEVVDGAL